MTVGRFTVMKSYRQADLSCVFVIYNREIRKYLFKVLDLHFNKNNQNNRRLHHNDTAFSRTKHIHFPQNEILKQ